MMYVALTAQTKPWYNLSPELDSRLGPSPSSEARKAMHKVNKRHLEYLAQHEKKLLQGIDPKHADQVYARLGVKRPGPGKDHGPEPDGTNIRRYRLGDLEAITVAGVRSHHHPAAEARTQASATWARMREQYYENMQNAAGKETSSWVVQANAETSDGWTTHDASVSQWPADAPGFNSEWADDDQSDAEDSDLWDDEGGPGYYAESRSVQWLVLPGTNQQPIALPTHPSSEDKSTPPSPVAPAREATTAPAISGLGPPTDWPEVEGHSLNAIEELARLLGDKKIMETCLDKAKRRLEESRKSRSEKAAETAVERQRYRPIHGARQQPARHEHKREDQTRSLRFRGHIVLSPEAAKLHKPEKKFQARFKERFEMTHLYEDAAGKVHTEPVATEGLPCEDTYKWMRARSKTT